MVVGMRNAPGVVVVETETVSRCRDDIIDRGLLGLRFVQITRVTQQMQTQIFSSAWLLAAGGLCVVLCKCDVYECQHPALVATLFNTS